MAETGEGCRGRVLGKEEEGAGQSELEGAWGRENCPNQTQ